MPDIRKTLYILKNILNPHQKRILHTLCIYVLEETLMIFYHPIIDMLRKI